MPTIVYKGDGKQFSVTGGCLAVMGRNSGAIENIKWLMEGRDIDNISTVTFKDILALKYCKDNIKYLDIFTAYMSMFPFMRCVKTPYEKILTTTHCTFDAENYTQNEIMHAMFHIRQLAYAYHNAFGNGGRHMIDVMYELVTQGAPFWKAFTLCMIPFHINPRVTLKPFNRVLEADANTFMLKSIPVTTFKKLISGRKPKPKYKGGTITENAEREKPYVQNMTEYLSVKDCIYGGSMAEFLTKVIQYAQESKSRTGLFDAFGHSISIGGDTYALENSDLLTALDKTLHEYGITGKGKITC